MGNTIKEIVAENLLSRMDKGETPTAFAKRLNVDQKTICRLLDMEMFPTTKTLNTMATALNIGAWELLIPAAKDSKRDTDTSKVGNTKECCTPEECELLETFRLTSPEHRALIIDQAKTVQSRYPLPSNVHRLSPKRNNRSNNGKA